MPESVTEQKKKGVAGKIAAVLFASFFLFNAIDSPIPGISYGELILAVAAALTFFDGAGSRLRLYSVHRDMLLFALICLTVTLATASFQPVFSISQFAVRTARWIFYIGCAAILGGRIDQKQLRALFFVIGVAASFFLIIQVVIYRTTGLTVTFQIGGQTLGGTAENIYTNGIRTGSIFRFSSFFSEPAHFSYYVILALTFTLIYRETLNLDMVTFGGIVIMLVALICCSSTYAILLTGVLVFAFFVLFLRYQKISRRSVMWATGSIFRFSSFFSEPAHFSYYVILALTFTLIYRETLNLDMVTFGGIVIMLVALICCSSTYAILLTGVLVFAFFVLFLRYQKISRRSVMWAVALLLAGIILLFVFRNSSLGNYLISKLVSVGNTSRTSFVWNQSHLFSTLQRCVGVGIGNEENYYSYMANTQMGYMNSFSMAFFYCGFTGVVLILLFYVKSWISFRSPARVLLVLFAAMSLYSTAFFSTVMVLYTVAIASGECEPVWCSRERSEA